MFEYWIPTIDTAAAKSLQSCPTLCDPIDDSPPGSPVPGILQARTLEWVAIFFSNAWKWKVKVKSLSRVQLLATPWTAAYQAPPSMGFSRQEYWGAIAFSAIDTRSVLNLFYWNIVVYNVLISGVQQSDSVTHTYIYLLFHILFHYGLLQYIKYSSLCCIIETCCLSILYIVVRMCWSQTLNPSLPYPFPSWQP